MRSFSISLLLVLLPAFLCLAAEEPLSVSSSLKTVTVYRTGAELGHNASAALPQGATTLVIEGISNAVDLNSIQVACPAAVTILSVEFSNNFLLLPDVSKRIRSLQDSADGIRRERSRIQVQINTLTELLEVLKTNRSIKGEQTGLSVAELAKLMEYYRQKSESIQNELLVLNEKTRKADQVLSIIGQQVREEESRNTRHRGQLHLQLSVAAAGKYDFSLSYITPNAHWTPFYDVRVENIRSPLQVIYKARINQTTGIDWKKVKLSLSTAVPTQWGTAPVLRSWFLSYINPVSIMDKSLAQNRIQSLHEKLEGNISGLELKKDIRVRGTTSVNGNNTPLYIVNGAIMSPEDFSRLSPATIKSTEILKDAEGAAMYGSRGANGVVVVTLKDGLGDYVSVTDNELNVTFDIDLPYDVPTNGKAQTATLREFAVPSVYKYYSVPKLDKDAYLLAEVADWEKLNLLPGDANIIFEGTYVGKSFIDPASTADTLNLTLGKDKRVVVKKEKLADLSSVKFLGSTKLQQLTYELTVKNNKKDTVRMLLKDQYPLTTQKEIEVLLADAGGAEVNTETGVLSWKLELAPGESKKVRFTYRVRYPKDRAVNLF